MSLPILPSLNLFALLRFDLVDAKGLESLAHSNLMQGLGSVLGYGAGCLSAPEFSYPVSEGGVKQVSIGPFQLYYSYSSVNEDGLPLFGPTPNTFGDGLNKGVQGIGLQHDPRVEGQQPLSLLDIDALVAQAVAAASGDGSIPFAGNESVFPFLYCRPVRIEAKEDVRRQFNTSTDAEEAVTVATRLLTRFEFKIQLEHPTVPVDVNGAPTQAPWIAVARCLRWSPDLESGTPSAPRFPRFFPIPVWDSVEASLFTKQPGTSEFSGSTSGVTSPDGVAPVSASQARLARFGQSPIPGANINTADFLSPYPSFSSGEFRRKTASLFNEGAGQSRSLGLTEILAIMRNVMLSHLANRNGTNRAPWYTAPARGLLDLSDLVDDLQAQVSSNDTDIAGLNTVTENLGEQASRILGHGRIFYANDSGSDEYRDFVSAWEGIASITRMSTGVVRVRVKGLNSATMHGVVVQPYAPSPEGFVGTVPDWPGFPVAGFDPATETVQHSVSLPEVYSPGGGAANQYEFTVKFRGGSPLVPVDCSFVFFLMGVFL